MKQFQTYKQFINEGKKGEDTLPDFQFDWKKAGSRWHFTIPFAEFKSRQLSKPEFATETNPKPIEVEQYFWKQAHNHDGSAHIKLLKGLEKYKENYKHAGDRWKEFRGWITDAMVRQGNMISETVGTVNAPIYDEEPEEFPEIALEKSTSKDKKRLTEIAGLLKELYSTALNCDCDGHKIKEKLYPKYKGTKVKMNITEDGKFTFDSFGKYPDVILNLKNMKKGNHTDTTLKEELEKHIKRISERISGMPSMSQIASFED